MQIKLFLLIILLLTTIPIAQAFTSDNDWRIIPNTFSFNQENTELQANLSGSGNVINSESALQGIVRFWQRIPTDTVQPEPFDLTSPSNGASSEDNTPLLTWTNSSDTNFDNYTIQIARFNNFSTIDYIYKSTTNSFSEWTASLNNGTWYWRVIAYDRYSNYRISNQNFSYSIAQVTAIPTIEPSPTRFSGGAKKTPFNIDIIAPPTVTIYSNEIIIVPLIITNPSDQVVLNYINISSFSDSEDIEPSLSIEKIPVLRPKEQVKLDLKITTHTEPGTYGITIMATVVNPSFTDSVRIYANLIDRDLENRSTASKQLAFAKKFFDANPSCSDLQQYLKQSELALQQKKFDQSINLANSAVEACKDLLALKGIPIKKVYTPETIIKNLLKNKYFPIIAIEILGLIVIIAVLSRFIKRRRRIHPEF